VGTLVIIGIWTWLFPELRRADQLTVDALIEHEVP
jgi:hypothetical protein